MSVIGAQLGTDSLVRSHMVGDCAGLATVAAVALAVASGCGARKWVSAGPTVDRGPVVPAALGPPASAGANTPAPVAAPSPAVASSTPSAAAAITSISPPGSNSAAGGDKGAPPSGAAQLAGTCSGGQACKDDEGATIGGWSFSITIANGTVVAAYLSNSCTAGPLWAADAKSLSVPLVKGGTTQVVMKCTVSGAMPEPVQDDCTIPFILQGQQIVVQGLPGSNGAEVKGTCSWAGR